MQVPLEGRRDSSNVRNICWLKYFLEKEGITMSVGKLVRCLLPSEVRQGDKVCLTGVILPRATVAFPAHAWEFKGISYYSLARGPAGMIAAG